MRTLWPSPAKLNLFLYITGQRADGYHHLQTLFQFLDYGDQLEIIPNETGDVVLVNRLPGVRKQDNLIYRAAIMLKQQAQQDKRLPASAGAMLKVNKKLPMGGGLGGGSSNAATTLLVLNHLWATGYRLSQLAEMGLSLGADIPVFIHGFSALAEGIGEQLQPAFPNEKWYLVAHPGVSISTQDLFSDPELIRNTPARSLDMLMKSDWHNDCEPVARKRFRKVEELLLWLLEYAPSRLTGTGACVFAEFNSEAAARQILAIAPEGIRAFVARGINISPLHQCLPE